MSKTAITPTREENYAEWYQQVIKAADLAETSPVRGCMVMKPWGYALWENMQRDLDQRFKATGHKNIYCPLFIPVSYLEKEAAHIDGFAKECAVVTHRRLAKGEDGKLIPVSPLEEPLIVRPTSETIIGEMFSRWIHSHRDLPLLVNQWANVVRWEMRTRLFLRTSEFLWQEGHTAHATAEEAQAESLQMLEVYRQFSEDIMAMPVICGEKTESERFPGAVNTYCIEAMMQDGRALQAGTSHFLGQNFAKAFEIKFAGTDGKESFVWTTSWGMSTRQIGALIMTHSDDDGLVLPPRLAPLHVVIIPTSLGQQAETVMAYCQEIADRLKALRFYDLPLMVEIDARDQTGGEKAWSWYKKGVPIQFEIGPREAEAKTISVRRRDQGYRQRQQLSVQEAVDNVVSTLDDIQKTLFLRAKTFRDERMHTIESEKDFYAFFKKDADDNKATRGFAKVYCNIDSAFEKKLKEELNVTVRCLPFSEQQKGKCIFTGASDAPLAVFAKAY